MNERRLTNGDIGAKSAHDRYTFPVDLDYFYARKFPNQSGKIILHFIRKLWQVKQMLRRNEGSYYRVYLRLAPDSPW